MGLQALIFDVDGAVAETAEIHRAAFNQAFEEFNTNWRWDIPIFSYLMKLADDKEMLNVFNAMSAQKQMVETLSDATIHRISLRKMQVYLAMIAGGAACLRNGVGELIEDAKRNDIVLAAASSRPRIEYEMLVTNTLGFDALSLFESAQSFANCGVTANCSHQKIISDLGITPARSVAIDATEIGTRCAAGLGIKTIATPGIYTSSGRFDAAELVVSDLGSPARPYEVIAGNADYCGYISIGYLQSLADRQRVAA